MGLRVWGRSLGIDGFAPSVELGAEFGGFGGVRGGEVVLFGRVGGEVVKLDAVVLVEMEQLPPAIAPPLSDVKTITVRSAIFSSSSFARMRPTLSSTLSTSAAYTAFFCGADPSRFARYFAMTSFFPAMG